MMMSELCPCGLTQTYAHCCKPFHDGLASCLTAERLMRSRFSSFYLKNIDYIIDTTLPAQQNQLDRTALQSWANSMDWTKLDVISHNKVGKRHAQVRFCAYFNDGQKQQAHNELSAFVHVNDRWYFLDPTLPLCLTNKQPCLCGSGEKFKACCGRFL